MTGLRQGELLALRWDDIDWNVRRVHARRSLGIDGTAKATKSGKVRSVPMSQKVAAALDGLSQRERLSGADDLVFPSWDGTPQYHGDVRARFKSALTAAGLKAIRFHDLRHTFGTLAAQTLPITTVQKLMGHADISTTLVYSHYVAADDEAAKLDEAFEAGTAQPAVIRAA